MKKGKILKTVRCKRGKTVTLEPFSLSRLKEFYNLYLSSKSEWEKFLVLHFKNIDDAKIFIAQQFTNDKFTGYFVIHNETDKLLGFIFGDEVNNNSILRSRATGFGYEGKGFGYEATQLFENLMQKAGYSSIILSCDAENTRSKELLLRDGYKYDKTEHFSIASVSLDLLFFSKCIQKNIVENNC